VSHWLFLMNKRFILWKLTENVNFVSLLIYIYIFIQKQGKEIARMKHLLEAHARVGRWMNTLFASFIPSRSRNDFIIQLGLRNDFPLNRRDVSRALGWHLQWNPDQRAQLVYHSLNDALRIYGTVAGTCFSCSWLRWLYLCAFARVCLRTCARISPPYKLNCN